MMIADSLKAIPNCRTRQTLLAITFLIAVRIITAKSLGVYESRSRYQCPPLPTSCSCSFVINDLEIQCPIEDPNIIVRIQPATYVQIECAKMSEEDYALLPQIDVGDANMVQIRRCPLPRGQSLEAILKRIGARRVRSLLFQSYGIDLGSSLVREHLRGFGDLERLVLSGNGLSDLPPDLFNDLRNLTWLDLKSNRIHMPRDIFANLDKLDYLELGYNNLQNLEPGLFRNQKRLKHLNMWGNNLQNLTMNSFEGISSIVDLDLSANKLTSLEPDVFRLLTNLTNINLSANNFTRLPIGLFENNKKLKQIRLLENRQQMETLPSEFLAELPELEDVRIKTALKILPEDMFSGSENIRNITLANNVLENLPAGLFANQTNLVDLDLSRNKLTELPEDIFIGTKSLVVLDLSYNKLENITSGLFGSLRNLVELYLQNNNLVNIDLRAFVGSLNLQMIEAQNNRLSFKDVAAGFGESDAYQIGSPFQYLSELKSLNLRNNSFGYIFADWIYNFRHLQSLDLSFNHINILSIIDLQFSSVNLALNLSHNFIDEIDFRQVGDITLPGKSISVEIGGNPLKCNCIILHFVQFLRGDIAPHLSENLNIAPGQLQCAGPQELQGRSVESLNYKELLCPLDSSSSQAKRCPSKCACWVRLIDFTLIVNCSYAGLTHVPPLPNTSEFGMRYIELHIVNNNITKLPHLDHPGYAAVKELHAKNNNISHITTKNIPTELSVLDISNNSMSWINASVFEAINRTSHLTQVLLGNNPWKCDCDAIHLLSFVRTNFKRIQDLSSMKCSSGAKLSSLSPGDLCKDELVTVLACFIAVLGLLFGLLAALYYRYQSEIKVWLYAHKMCLWFVTEEELDKDKKYDAFISYSHKDDEFVTELMHNLENGPVKYKLCLHERDWVVGDFIPSQIVRSVEESRRTIVVLSPNFLESIWGRMEFQAAHKAALQEGRARIIVIIFGEIGNTDNLDPELKAYLTMNTYIKWGDPWFWKRLRYAMPHPQLHGLSASKGLVKNALNSSTDDKLELIKPIPITPPPLTTPPAEEANKNPLLTKLNGSIANGGPTIGGGYTHQNGKIMNDGINGHVNGAFIINTNAKQSDV